MAESTVVYTSERERVGRPFDEADRKKVEALVARMEAEMRQAAKELEFERAAALRDEIQQIRLRVLEQDASVTVARAAERAAGDRAAATARRPDRRGRSGPRSPGRGGRRGGRTGHGGDERHRPARRGGAVGDARRRAREATATASDWLPGIRDEHDDDGGWQARWLDRPTWDRTVTPNIRKRTGPAPADGRRAADLSGRQHRRCRRTARARSGAGSMMPKTSSV